MDDQVSSQPLHFHYVLNNWLRRNRLLNRKACAVQIWLLKNILCLITKLKFDNVFFFFGCACDFKSSRVMSLVLK